MSTLTDVKGIGEGRAENFREEGFDSVDDVAGAEPQELTEVKGVGEATAYDLVESAQQVLQEEHLDAEEDEEDEEEVAPEDKDRDDVTLEDIEEINEEPPEPDTPDDEELPDSEVEIEQQSEPDTYPIELFVAERQYDYFMRALVEMKLTRRGSNVEMINTLNAALDELREVRGEGTIHLDLEDVQINYLHSAIQQAEVNHQQNRQNEAFEAMRDLKQKLDDQRRQYLF